jgi:hypothetical protein
MNAVKITIEHDGTTYYGTVMRIKKTTLGVEDHGVFTAHLHCEGNGSGVGLGGYSLDSWSEEDKRRIGTAYGLDHIKAILSTVGVDRWEALPGINLIVLNESEHPLGTTPVGFADITGERVLIFKDHAEAWKQREAAA